MVLMLIPYFLTLFHTPLACGAAVCAYKRPDPDVGPASLLATPGASTPPAERRISRRYRFLRPSESFIVRMRSLENTRAAIVTNTANHTSW